MGCDTEAHSVVCLAGRQVTFKCKLALLGLRFHPKSWHIVNGEWVADRGGAPPPELDDGKTVRVRVRACVCVCIPVTRRARTQGVAIVALQAKAHFQHLALLL